MLESSSASDPADVTYPKQFRLFTDRYYDLRPPTFFNLVSLSLIPAIVPFLLGLGIAFAIGFQGTFLSSPPVYLGSFGICWVFASMRIVSLRYYHALASVGPYVDKPRQEYLGFVTARLTRLSRDSHSVACVAGLACLGMVAAAFAFLWPDASLFDTMPALRPTLFPIQWYDGYNSLAKLAVIDIYAIFIAIPLGVASWGVTANIFFVKDLADLRFIPVPGALVRALGRLISLYQFTGATWFVGLALFVFLFFASLDTISLSIIIILGFLGSATFVLPHYFFHQAISQAANELARKTVDVYVKYVSTGERISSSGQLREMLMLSTVLQATSATPTWVFNPRDVTILILGQVLALASGLLRQQLFPPTGPVP